MKIYCNNHGIIFISPIPVILKLTTFLCAELNNTKACHCVFRKNMQRNKQVAMGRKKFNMDPKKVSRSVSLSLRLSRSLC